MNLLGLEALGRHDEQTNLIKIYKARDHNSTVLVDKGPGRQTKWN